MYLWLLVFWLQPHKGQLISEDFFLYSYYVSCNKNDSKHSIVLLLCLLSFLLHHFWRLCQKSAKKIGFFWNIKRQVKIHLRLTDLYRGEISVPCLSSNLSGRGLVSRYNPEIMVCFSGQSPHQTLSRSYPVDFLFVFGPHYIAECYENCGTLSKLSCLYGHLEGLKSYELLRRVFLQTR